MNDWLVVCAIGLSAWLVWRMPERRLPTFSPAADARPVLAARGLAFLQRQLRGVPGAPKLWMRMILGLTCALVVLWLLPGLTGGLLGGLAGVSAVLALGRMSGERGQGQRVAELPNALEFLAVCLDAGLPLPQAVAVTAEVLEPARSFLEGVSAQYRLGRAGSLAWEEARADPVWGKVAADIARAEQSGTVLSETLRVHAEENRLIWQESVTKAAKTVGVKSVIPLVVCFLPAFVLVGVVPLVFGLMKDFFG